MLACYYADLSGDKLACYKDLSRGKLQEPLFCVIEDSFEEYNTFVNKDLKSFLLRDVRVPEQYDYLNEIFHSDYDYFEIPRLTESAPEEEETPDITPDPEPESDPEPEQEPELAVAVDHGQKRLELSGHQRLEFLLGGTERKLAVCTEYILHSDLVTVCVFAFYTNCHNIRI